MNRLRNVLARWLTTLLVALVASPALAAPEKIFSLQMAVVSLSGSTATLRATFRNETPTGNSSINSLILSAPASGFTIVAGSVSAPNGIAQVAASGSSISIENMSPVKNGQTFVVTFQASVPATTVAACSTLTGTWNAQAWTGSSFSGENFRLLPPPTSILATTVAPTCNYSVRLSPTSFPAGSTAQALAATFKNENPAGSASIATVALTAPTGFTITSAASPGGGTVSFGPGAASVAGLSLAPGASLTVNLQLSTGCAATSGTWGSTASSSAAGAFSLLPPPASTLTTGIAGNCALQFVVPPQSVVTGQLLSPAVQVALVGGSGPVATFTGTVSLTASGPGSLGGTTSVAAEAGVATFPALTLSKTGSYTLTASASGYPSVTSSSFSAYDGDLNCNDELAALLVNPSSKPEGEPGYVAGKRGLFNKDGSSCIKVKYSFVNNILVDNSVSLVWDLGAQPHAAFLYTATWQDEAVDPSTGSPTRRTRVAFSYDGSGNRIVNFGVACLAPALPATYGTLAAAITAGATSVDLNTSGAAAALPIAYPYPLIVGTERMDVTAATGSTLTVVRGVGGTTAVAHAGGDVAMSTPLPIDPNPYLPGAGGLPDATKPNPSLGKQVPMCIWDEGWVAVGGGKVRFTTSVFDIGDGFMIR